MQGRLTIPWMLKAGIQSALSRVPAGESINFQLQRLNGRYTPERTRRRILDQAQKIARLRQYVAGGTVVEIGTGWELISPLLFYLCGARQVITVDHLRHLRFATVRLVLEQFAGLAPDLGRLLGADLTARLSFLEDAATLEDALRIAGIRYLAPAGTADLETSSADLFYTHEVLEHIPEPELRPLISESRRILKPAGVAYHAIEPGDHYATCRVDHLRYSDKLWKVLAENSIYSHNRLAAADFIRLFQATGAVLLHVENKSNAGDVALLKNGFRRGRRFVGLPAEELAVWYSELLLTFPS